MLKQAKILIIDDEIAMCRFLSEIVKRMGHDSTSRQSAREGLQEAISGDYDVVLLDVHMPDGSGLDILPQIKNAAYSPEVIIITGFGDEKGAETAIKNGAWDYIQKTDSINQIILPLKRVLQFREEVRRARRQKEILDLDGIVGKHPAMKACYERLAQAACSDVNVLLSGETGTGKELFAKAIHRNSSRRDYNFVIVDCTTLPETLAESLLFGHLKGAFTGAVNDRQGLVWQAEGGTLFLDEIGELSGEIQKIFLRVLQERTIRPLGTHKEVHCHFRLIAATNRDLDQQVKDGRFRKDLLFRLRTLEIKLPPLNNRSQDIQDLAFYYMNYFCEKGNVQSKGFSPDFLYSLTHYHWPGNVRELLSAVEHAISAAGSQQILFSIHLPDYIRMELTRLSIRKQQQKQKNGSIRSKTPHPASLPEISVILEATERQYLIDLMTICQWNIKDACKTSGLSRTRLYSRLQKYDIRRNG